jgi:hypothetical protein
MSSTRPKADPIVQDKPGTAGGSVHNASPNSKSLGSKGPNFTRDTGGKSSWPVPNSPYGKD